MNTDKLMNPDADQPQSQQEKKEKKKKKNPVQPRSKPIHRRNPTQFNPDQNPYTAEKEKPSSTTKKQKPTHRRSTSITTGKTKKTQINPDQHPDIAAARSVFPPLSINLDQPPKSHWNKNPDIIDQPQSQQQQQQKKKKKKPRSTPIKTQTSPPLDQRFLHR